MENGNRIIVWYFYDAPEEYQKLSTNGGDEDWLALLPPGMSVPFWMEAGSRFGCCCVDEFKQPDGSTVVIGSHS
jgi:hypothetical protein